MSRWTACMALFLFWTVSGCTMSSQVEKPRVESAGEAGSKYRFTLQSIDGSAVSLDGLLANHKAVLLNFWATWCPYCREEMPNLIKLQEKYRDKSFTVVGVNVGESLREAEGYAKKAGLNYPTLLDADMQVSEIYGVMGLPTSILIRADGKVLGVYHDVSQALIADVEKVLAG